MDAKSVMSGLEGLTEYDWRMYHSDSEVRNIARDAIDLLKEQDELLRKLQKDKDKLCLDVSEWKHKYHDRPLKEQEAKVLTVDQLEDALDTVVWLETPVSENLADGYSLIMAYSHKYRYMYFDSPFGDNPSQDSLEYSEYGRSWRCWNRRPSEEQRKAVSWND